MKGRVRDYFRYCIILGKTFPLCIDLVINRVVLIIKPTGCKNFSNLFFGIKLYMFRTGVFHYAHSNGICHTGFDDSLQTGSGRNWFRPDPARKLSAYLCDILCVT